MSKAPAFQFYVKDWLTDTELQSCCPATRGIWINALALMWTAKDRGMLVGTRDSLARLLNCSRPEFDQFLEEGGVTNFVHVTENSELVTLINRRMYREDEARRKTRERVRKHRAKQDGNGESNADVTVPSSSSSSSPCTKVHSEEVSDDTSCGRDEPGLPSCPHQEIVSLYHRTLPELTRMRTWGDQRRKFLRARWREHPELEWWKGFFKYVRKSSFLMGLVDTGNGKPPFQADLEWLVRPSNMAKVVDGKYHR